MFSIQQYGDGDVDEGEVAGGDTAILLEPTYQGATGAPGENLITRFHVVADAKGRPVRSPRRQA